MNFAYNNLPLSITMAVFIVLSIIGFGYLCNRYVSPLVARIPERIVIFGIYFTLAVVVVASRLYWVP